MFNVVHFMAFSLRPLSPSSQYSRVPDTEDDVCDERISEQEPYLFISSEWRSKWQIRGLIILSLTLVLVFIQNIISNIVTSSQIEIIHNVLPMALVWLAWVKIHSYNYKS